MLDSDAFGMVYLSRSSGVVSVRVQTVTGELLYSGVTQPSGIFILPQGLPLPPAYRLLAETPEGVTVERYVEGAQPPYLFINVFSHLVSRYLRAYPGTPLAEAEQRVMVSLGLSAKTGVYGLGNGFGSRFSHQVFLKAAQGNFEAFCDQLVRDIHDGRNRRFAGPLSSALPVEFAEEGANAADVIGEFLLHETASGLFEFLAEGAIGKITSYFGLNIGTYGALEQIKDQLTDLQDSIDQLANKISGLGIANVIISDQANLNSQLDNLRAINKELSDTAKAGAAAYLSNPTATDHGPSPVDPTVLSLVSAFSKFQVDTTNSALTSALTSNVLNANLLSASASNISLVYGSENPSPAYDYLEIRHDADLAALQKQLSWLASWTVMCQNVYSEIANGGYLPGATKAPAVAINEAQSNVIGLFSMLHVAQQAVPSPCGTELVMVDAKNKLMWYLPTSLVKYDKAQNGMIDLSVINWTYAPGVSKPQKVGSSVSKDLVDFYRPNNMPGWRVPTQSELGKLYTLVQGAGGGAGHSTSSTESALKKLGFTGLDPSHDNYKKVWFNGSVQTIERKDYFRFYYFNLATGKSDDYDSHEDSSLLHPDADPLYTCIYVRSLPDTQFGDTSDQIHKSYGIAASATSLNVTDISTSQVGMRTIQLRSEDGGDLGDRARWSIQLPNGSDASSVAYLNYQGNFAQLIFRAPGTVLLTGAFSPAQNVAQPSGSSSTSTISNPTKPLLTSITISPQNLNLSNAPGGSSLRFFCSGSLASKEQVDLTNRVTWTLMTSRRVAVDPNDAYFNVNLGGNLIFNTSKLPDSKFIVNATLTGPDPQGQSWTSNNQTLGSEAIFEVPAAPSI